MSGPRLPGPVSIEHLQRARALARALDTAFRVPGTRIRFGLDAILGLIPGAGDLVTAVLALYPAWLASHLPAPRRLVYRMLGNIAIDLVVGTVPILGDAFDVSWRANSRNLALLERALAEAAIGGETDVL